jgi:hypothetical protein
MYTLIINH